MNQVQDIYTPERTGRETPSTPGSRTLFRPWPDIIALYWVTQKLPQIYTANHATFPIRIRKITVQKYFSYSKLLYKMS